ncbi:MAG TPA: tetratricopeptide repeat protein, partial [Pirellulales bacterium]
MPDQPTVRYEIRWRMLAITCAVIVVGGIASYFWHRWQVGRMANSMLVRAEKLEQEKQYDEAKSYLFKYISLRPTDVESHVRLALLADQTAKTPGQRIQATQLLHQATGLAKNRIDLHQRLAEQLLFLQRFSAARAEAQTVLAAKRGDPSGTRVLALATFFPATIDGSDNWEKIGTDLAIALKANPKDLQLARCLAELDRKRLQPPQPEDADRTMDQVVEANSSSVDALLARMLYRRAYQLAGEDDDLAAALTVAPRDPRVLLIAAEQAAAQKHWKEAREFYTTLVDAEPKNSAGYVGQGNMYLQEGEIDKAISAWRAGLEQVGPDDLRLIGRLFELSLSRKQFVDAEEELKSFDAAIRKMQPRISPRDVTHLTDERDFLRAKLLLGQSKLPQALPILRRLAAQPEMPPEFAFIEVSPKIVQWFLAQTLERLGQFEDSAVVYDKVVNAQPLEPLTRAAAAKAWAAAGQFDAALRHFEVLVLQKRMPSDGWLPYLQTLYQQQARLPESDRNWKTFERALGQIPESVVDGWRIVLLRANQAVLAGHADEALAVLALMEKNYSQQAECLRAVALSFQKLGKPADADRVLAEAEQIDSKSPAAIFAQAQMLSQRGAHQDAIALLGAMEATVSISERAAFERLRAHELLADGKRDDARRLLSNLLQTKPADAPDDLQSLQELVELALDARDMDDAKRWEQRLHEREGEEGTTWRVFRAQRLLSAAGSPSNETIEEATRLIAEVEAKRPYSSQTYLLRGMLAERQGSVPEAIASYRKAIASGDQRLPVYQRLITLLYQDRQMEEADKLLSQLKEQASSSDELSSMAVAISLRRDEIDRGIGLAKEWVERKPDDPMGYIWLGQAQLLAKDSKSAEASFVKATQLAPKEVRTWHVLFNFYLQANRPDDARQTLANMEEQTVLPQTQKAIVLGQEYELLKDFKTAAKHYEQAASLSPNDSAIQQQLTGFFLRWDDPASDEALKRIEQTTKNAEVRRNLAVKMARSGGADSWKSAMKLLDAADANPAEVPFNNRVRAALLANRGHEKDVREAIKLLTALVADSQHVQNGDRMLLAKLDEIVGQPQAAREQFEALTSRKNVEPAYLAAFADFLLRTEQLGDADLWIKQFEKQQPGTSGVALRARWLAAKHRTAEIEPLIESAIKPTLAKLNPGPEKAKLEMTVGQLYAQVGLNDLAIKYMQSAYDQAHELYAPLVSATVAQKRVAEAIQLCSAALIANPGPQPAQTLAIALTASNCSAADCHLADSFLSAAEEQYPDNIQLLLAISGVRFLEGELNEVVRICRAVLKRDPENVLALNNLSSLLTEQAGHEAEALEIVDRAIEIDGRTPALLDTKAMILLRQNRAKDAVALLDESLSRT